MSGTEPSRTSTGATALSVIKHKGEPFLSVPDLVACLSGMVDSLPPDTEQRKPLVMLRDTFAEMLAPKPSASPPRIQAQRCPFCRRPVVILPALGRDKPVAVETHSSPDGEWVPIDHRDGTTTLVPYEGRLDGVGARVPTHVCTNDGGAAQS